MRRWTGFTLIFFIIFGSSLPIANAAYSDLIITEEEPNNDFLRPNTTYLTSEVNGTLTNRDSDLYRIDIPNRGGFSLYGLTDADQQEVEVRLYREENGEYVLIGEGESIDNEFYLEQLIQPGMYYIQVSTSEDSEFTGEAYAFTTEMTTEYMWRITGNDRYETASNLAFDTWLGDCEEVVLATGQDFPDALASGPLAYYLDAPILLTRKDSIPEPTLTFIKHKQVQRITIIGGTGVISLQTENYLRKTLGLTVKRIAGKDRFETAALVAKELPEVTAAVVVNGRNYPDALSVSPLAARMGMPILLAEVNSLPTSTAGALSGLEGAFVIGGTGVISDTVYNKLPDPYRIGGKDRYETSKLILEFMPSFSSFLTTGTNFADALAGSAVAARRGEPILLTPPNGLPEVLKDENLGVLSYTILGGTGAVSKKVEQDVWDVINLLNYN